MRLAASFSDDGFTWMVKFFLPVCEFLRFRLVNDVFPLVFGYLGLQ